MRPHVGMSTIARWAAVVALGVGVPSVGHAAVRINEVVVDHVGFDDHEYLEVNGDKDIDFSGTWLLVVDGDDQPGWIDAAFDLGVMDAYGQWSTGFLVDSLDGGSFTVLLVTGFSGASGDDLDTDDDGVFDETPWTGLVDDVAVDAGGGVVYSTTVVGDGFGGLAGVPTGLSRVPNGVDTDSSGDWRRNDFDGYGLPGFIGSATDGEAYNTPGSANIATRPADYYATLDTSTQAAARASLHEIIDDHLRYPYADAATDTWDIINLADRDPADPTHILAIYKNASYATIDGGNGAYNREHSWPKSYGFPDDDGMVMPYTDTHHLFASNVGYNSDRGNKPFGPCSAACAEYATDVNGGEGGGVGVYPGNSNWMSTYWETWIGRRGDIARAMLYMDVRYEGGVHGVTGVAEPDLILTDNPALISGTGSNASVAYMGLLSTILQWHAEDPPSDRDRRRNDVVYSYQGNRNPFVDRPELAGCIYLGICGEPPVFADDFEGGTLAAWSTSVGG